MRPLQLRRLFFTPETKSDHDTTVLIVKTIESTYLGTCVPVFVHDSSLTITDLDQAVNYHLPLEQDLRRCGDGNNSRPAVGQLETGSARQFFLIPCREIGLRFLAFIREPTLLSFMSQKTAITEPHGNW